MNAPYPTLVESSDRRLPRHAQLLYTSYDDGSGAGGGWQIKDETGELTLAERDELTARVVTRFDVGAALPQFPTPDQIAQRLARLAYCMLDGRAAAYWHTVDAGIDATRRPGNVMAHVLLDRAISAPSALRPIQLWASGGWLRPYGPAEVSAAVLAEGQWPEPNPEITADAAVHFLTGTSVDRQGVFRVLLDAVYAALNSGPKIILVVDDPADGPRWIAAVSFFMSPGTARGFSWSTYDTADLALADVRRGTDLVVVPRSAVDELPIGDWLIMDENDEPTVRELGSVHSTRTAQITVTAWSVLAEGVLADEDLAPAILARQDEVAAEVGDHKLAPCWPLAVAVLEESALAEFRNEAQRALADEAPAHISSVDRLNDLVTDAAIATAPQTPAEALKRLSMAARGTGGVRPAEHLLRVVSADPAYLDNLALNEVPAVHCLSRQTWEPMMSAWSDVGHDPTGHTARRLIRMAELLDRLAEPEPNGPDRIGAFIPLLRQAGLDCLWSPDSSILTAQLDISARVRESVVRGALADVAAADLAKITVRTWRWIFADEHTPALRMAAPAANPGRADRVLYPRYVCALISAQVRDEVTPEERSAITRYWSEIAGLAVFTAVEADQIPDIECRSLVTSLAPVAQLDDREIVDLLTSWPHRVSPAIAIKTVLYHPASVDLLATTARHSCEESQSVADVVTVSAARLRVYSVPDPSYSVNELAAAITSAAPLLLDHLLVEHINDIAPGLVVALGGAFVAAQCSGATWADPNTPVARALAQRVKTEYHAVNSFVARLVEIGIIDVNWVAGQAFLARIDSEFVLSSLLSAGRGRDRASEWADDAVTLLAAEKCYQGPRDAATLRDSAWPSVRTLTAAEAERFFARYERAAKEWLRDHRF